VTEQAVSKWERGKGLPDVSVLITMSELLDVEIDVLLGGKENKEKIYENQKKGNDKRLTKIKVTMIGTLLILILVIVVSIIIQFKDNHFEVKTLSSNCSNFKISGIAVFNKERTVLNISNIEFCGTNQKTIYKKISCNLYENYNDKKNLISSCQSKENINLENYLKEVNINVSNYEYLCPKPKTNALFLEIYATNEENKNIEYKIPIKLNDNCD